MLNIRGNTSIKQGALWNAVSLDTSMMNGRILSARNTSQQACCLAVILCMCDILSWRVVWLLGGWHERASTWSADLVHTADLGFVAEQVSWTCSWFSSIRQEALLSSGTWRAELSGQLKPLSCNRVQDILERPRFISESRLKLIRCGALSVTPVSGKPDIYQSTKVY